MAATLTFLYDLKSELANTLTVDQVVSTIIFGSAGIDGVYEPTHTYGEGDIVEYIDGDGVIHVYECVQNGATGDPIDLTYWKEYSIVEKMESLRTGLILLSSTRPADVYNNKVWIRPKSEESGTIDPDDNYGLIVTQNFIISPNEPTPFTTDLVWGQVTSGNTSL